MDFDHRKFLKYDKASSRSTCLVCGKVLRGYLTTRIKCHFKLVHKVNLCEEPKKKSSRKKTAHIQLDRDEFMVQVIRLIAENGLPIRVCDSPSFKSLIRPYEQAFNYDLNSNYLSRYSVALSSKIRNEIGNVFCDKMLNLKLDVVTCGRKSYLKISAQYIKVFKMKLVTLGVVELFDNPNGVNIEESVLKCLQEYQISAEQIYSVTTDNGAKMIKAARSLVSLDQNEESEVKSEGHEIECDDEEVIYEDEDNWDTELIFEKLKFSHINKIRCGSHLLQLVARNSIKSHEIEVKSACENVKKIHFHLIQTNSTLSLPNLETEMGWNLIYDVLNQSLAMRPALKNVVPDRYWEFAKTFVQAFWPLADLENRMLKTQYLIGDFVRDWLFCESQILGLAFNKFAGVLLHELETKRNLLMLNPAVLAALYLDPRFNFEGGVYLKAEQKTVAVVSKNEIIGII